MKFLQVFMVLSTLLLKLGNGQYTKPATVEHEIPLQPFQLLYFTNTPETRSFETTSMNGMSLLEVTRSHIESCLAPRDPFFIRLTIYFSIRSKDLDMFQNGTKVAFAGNAYYTLPRSVAKQEDIASDTLLCFLGQNHTDYIKSLQSMGWDLVEKTQVMTLAGDMIEMSKDGGMIIMSKDSEESAMQDGTSVMIILVATIVPLSLIVFAASIWFLYKLCFGLSWKSPKTADENDPIWAVNHPMSKVKRFQSTRKSYINITPSNRELDQASVQVAVHSKTQSPV